jgi:hypothetical protein
MEQYISIKTVTTEAVCNPELENKPVIGIFRQGFFYDYHLYATEADLLWSQPRGLVRIGKCFPDGSVKWLVVEQEVRGIQDEHGIRILYEITDAGREALKKAQSW